MISVEEQEANDLFGKLDQNWLDRHSTILSLSDSHTIRLMTSVDTVYSILPDLCLHCLPFDRVQAEGELIVYSESSGFSLNID